MSSTTRVHGDSAGWWASSARHMAGTILLAAVFSFLMAAPAKVAQAASGDRPAHAACRLESMDYRGWKAQQISNRWVQLVIVPENGGRLMQVTFNGHDFLFVNPKLAGKRMPPTANRWFNYGGDKIWLLPEGDEDEQHWRGGSDMIDSGEFAFRKLSDESSCGLELTGPPDPHTGVQISRTIRLGSDSPHIAFHASMKNITGHTIEWSMQSVSQYDTSNPNDASQSNGNIWGFTATNRSSGYLNRYHVRTGPAENPSATVRGDGLFSLRYSRVAAEFWIDSTDGWLAVVDGSSRYAMVERFQYEDQRPYPGKAAVIFWTNGPHLKFGSDGTVSVTDGPDGPSPSYMEAEVNSPLCRMRPGGSCQLDTDWFPTRSDVDFIGVTEAGIVTEPLRAVRLQDGKVKVSGSFGVFFPGKVVAHYYNERGSSIGSLQLAEASPANLLSLNAETSPEGKAARMSLHLEDENGLDRGALGEIAVVPEENR